MTATKKTKGQRRKKATQLPASKKPSSAGDTPPSATPGIPMDILRQAAAVLRVLAHPDRLKMTELLMHDRLSVGNLASTLKLRPHAVSQHLNLMRAHQILDAQRDGRVVYYRVVNPNAERVIECIQRHGAGIEFRGADGEGI